MSKNNYLWVDKYRPTKLVDYVWSDESQRAQVTNWVKEKHIPNCLFVGGPGTGKSTLAKCLLNELEVDETDVRYVNGSHTNGVDDIRELSRFIETIPNGDFRYVFMDECLDENTLVSILRSNDEILIPIKNLDQKNDLVKTYNIEANQIEWKSFELINNGKRDVLEIEFENGEKIICTPNHKWYVEDSFGNIIVTTADQLHKYTHIITI